MPASFGSAIKQFFSDLAAADYTPGNMLAVAQQYYDTTGPNGAKRFVPYAVSNGGYYLDSSSLPASGCTDHAGTGVTPVCLTDAALQAEIKAVIAAHHLPQNSNTDYFLFTPKNVGSCFDGSSSYCSYKNYCGYHSYFEGTGSGQNVIYANMPWTYKTSCDAEKTYGFGYPDSSEADPAISLVTHELIESMTDPVMTGWYDSNGFEVGDKCERVYGTGGVGSKQGLYNNGTAYWNQDLNGRHYLIQWMFSNYDSDGSATGCVGSDDEPQPTAAVSITPSPPVHGSSTEFKAGVKDAAGVNAVKWTFGDGSSASGTTVKHTYVTAGSRTVTLIVTDGAGQEKRVVKTIAVS